MRAGFVASVVGCLVAVAPGTAWAAPGCKLTKFLELPVTMTADHEPITAMSINGRPARFMVDSGAFFSSMSKAAAAAYGLREESAPPGFFVTGIGGQATARVVTVKNLQVGGQSAGKWQFLTLGSDDDYAGLLGANILGVADTEYDLAGGVIRLFRPTACKDGAQAYWSGSKPLSAITIKSKIDAQYHIMGDVYLNGKRLTAMFDTGAATSMISLDAAKRAGVAPDSAGVEEAGYSHGIGRKGVRTWIGPFDNLKIGDEEIRRIKLRFGDFNGDGFDMLIGADFFLSHRLYVSNAEHRIYFTYNGGPVFDLSRRSGGSGASAMASTGTGQDPDEPGTADAFARRGAARGSRRDYAGAIADLDKAVGLEPKSAAFLYQRALIHADMGEPRRSMVDVNDALAIAPDDPDARILRARLRLGMGDKAAAREDIDRIAQLLPAAANQRLELGAMYDLLGDPAAGITQFDQWLPLHKEDPRFPQGLNGRCWARALANRDLDAALDDCNRALRLRPNEPSYLDSRGLVELRLGQYDKSVADYTGALAGHPRSAWSLFGRGLARQKLGRKEEAAADIKAALEIEPKQAEIAGRYGLKPAE